MSEIKRISRTEKIQVGVTHHCDISVLCGVDMSDPTLNKYVIGFRCGDEMAFVELSDMAMNARDFFESLRKLLNECADA